MILVDTNVLVALADERDALHGQASRDARSLGRGPFGVTSLVLGEVCFLLPDRYLRSRLRFMLEHLPIEPVEPGPPWWPAVFAWLERYADHDPDLADAQLAVLSAEIPSAQVWTYDREFRTVWKRPDGTAIPLATRSRGPR